MKTPFSNRQLEGAYKRARREQLKTQVYDEKYLPSARIKSQMILMKRRNDMASTPRLTDAAPVMPD